MEIIHCEIKNQIANETRSYFELIEINRGNKYIITSDKAYILRDFQPQKSYSFIKEKTKSGNSYLSIIHPDYELGKEVVCEIIDVKIVDKKYYFYLNTPYNTQISVIGSELQKELKKLKCKINGFKRGIPKLINIEYSTELYKIGEKLTLNVLDYLEILDANEIQQKYLIVQGLYNETIQIKSYSWYTKDYIVNKYIDVEVIGYYNLGKPIFNIIDKKHPYFEIDTIQVFTIIDFVQKLKKTGEPINVIKLRDNHGFFHEVASLNNQNLKFKIGEKIECRIVDVGKNIKLSQVNIQDPFFCTFSDIITDEECKKKYFNPFLNEDNDENSKFYNQYKNKSAFWVLTYCNYIIPKIKKSHRERKDFKELISVLELHNKIESWILKSGILKTILDDIERKSAKLKIQTAIKNNEIDIKIINIITEFKDLDFLKEQIASPDFQELYYYLTYKKIENIDPILFSKAITKYHQKLEITDKNSFFINCIIGFIRKNNYHLLSEINFNNLILSPITSHIDSININTYLKWCYIEILLSNILAKNEESNLCLARLYRYFSYLNVNIKIKEKLLFNAFYIVSNPHNKYFLPIEINNNQLTLRIQDLEENPNAIALNNIKLSLNKSYKGTITEKHYQGYNICIDNISGFLPSQNIVDKKLKQYEFSRINWTTNIEITIFSEEFNYFITKQVLRDSSEYYSKNNLEDNTAKKGDILIGKVNGVSTWGVYVNTEKGVGLLNIKNISSNFIDRIDLPFMFKADQKIPVYVKNINKETGKLELSLLELKNSEYALEYERILNYNLYDTVIETSVINEKPISFYCEEEKGQIFESFAILQNDINEKIKYIKFAKVFYSNTKNARSYLLNMNIEYFYALLKLDILLTNYSLNNYDEFRFEIMKIKNKIDDKTLTNFPESKNLIYFIDILSMFNSQNEEDLDNLFEMTKSASKEKNLTLKTVTRSVLANNLLLTELLQSDWDEFSLKNLRRIRQFITNGVLSIEETPEDILEKQLDEKRIYYKKLISGDESEKLEFKATFISPVPNTKKQTILRNLENQLQSAKSESEKEIINNKIRGINEETLNTPNIKQKIIHSALKTICAFANTKGGILLLGVGDDKKIYGLEKDYESLGALDNRDEFGKHFDSVVRDNFGDSFSATHLEKEFLKFPEGDVLIISVKESKEEVFMLKNELGQKEDSLYVRQLSSSCILKGVELAKFIKSKMR